EGCPVVGTDGPGQAVDAKEPLEALQRGTQLRGGEAVAGEQEARGRVFYGQRKAVLAVAEPEFSFEVCRPDVVGASGLKRRGARVAVATARLAMLHKSVARKDAASRAGRRPPTIWISAAQR